jgi:hypothetical protein
MIIYSDVLTVEQERKPQDWQKVFTQPTTKRYFVCQRDPILIADRLYEELNPDELRTVMSELAIRTGMNF